MKKEFSHENYNDIMELSNKKLNGFPIPLLFFGETGSGKSYVAKQLATKLGLRYGFQSCNGQTSKSDLMGSDVIGTKTISMLQEFYQNGGVFVLEEIDTVTPDIAVVINTMIDSAQGSFNNEMIDRHEDFHLLATSNTYGGATDAFTARKLLDQSTLERFIKVEFKTDPELERNLMGHEHKIIEKIRENVLHDKIHFSMRSALMMIQMKSLGLKKALNATALRNHPGIYHERFSEIEKLTSGFSSEEKIKELESLGFMVKYDRYEDYLNKEEIKNLKGKEYYGIKDN